MSPDDSTAVHLVRSKRSYVFNPPFKPPVYDTFSTQAAWVIAVDYVSLGISCFGMVSNILVVITIFRSNILQKKASILIGHQALIDLIICLFGVLKLVNYDNKPVHTSIPPLDLALCYLWTSQLLFWIFVMISVQILVLIAMDRYLAVAQPIRYRSMGVRNYIAAYLFAYVFAFFINCSVLVDTVWFDGKRCFGNEFHYGRSVGMYGTPSYQLVGFLWLCFLYFLPSTMLIMFYTMTLKSYHKVRFKGNSAMSRHRSRITNQLMKSSIVVTALYFFAFIVEALYMILALFGRTDIRDSNNPINRIGSLLLNFHAMNPLIYCMLMKSFRNQMVVTLSCGRIKKTGAEVEPEERAVTSIILKPDSEIVLTDSPKLTA